MLNLREEIQDAFYLTTLDTFYNPAHDQGMAEQLVGTYVFNAAATQCCEEIVAEMGAAEKAKALELMERLARANLETAARKLGNRTVECAALAVSAETICRYGTYPVQAATGYPVVAPFRKKQALAPPTKLNYLRLYKEPPRQGKHPEFWDVHMVDELCQPLVQVSVTSRSTFMNRLVDGLPHVRDSFGPFF